ncbi:MAG TPA: SDR family NAD(P)-dependent oxidoreductase [Ilumatobacteraceae bacterium]|nr:SDR family NAD(P)-dependent oxidoreductase [Ilumatobacteraceae bacterium]
MADGRLAGLVAVVVGAGQTPGETIGNGRAIATTFAREGAEVLCVDRIADRAEETANSIRERSGLANAFTADVTEDEQCAAVVAHALTTWDRVDVLVNVVGIGGRGDGPAHSADGAAFERILDVNLTAMWRMCRAALPSMRERRRGSIVNVSSAASFAGGFQVAYEVSKAGVNRLTTSIAQSNASRGVRCNAIALGLVDTPMAVGGIAAARGVSLDEVREERDRQVPLLGGMGTAWDAANAALFLASDEARFVTGVVLPVDGGTSIRIG